MTLVDAFPGWPTLLSMLQVLHVQNHILHQDLIDVFRFRVVPESSIFNSGIGKLDHPVTKFAQA